LSDGSVRAVTFAGMPPSVPLGASPAALARPDPRTLVAASRVEVPDAARARLAALQWTEDVPAEARVRVECRRDGALLEMGRSVNAARDPQGTIAPGWVLGDAWLTAPGDVDCVVEAEASGLLDRLPFACDGGLCDVGPAAPQPFSLWLLGEEPLAPSEAIVVRRATGDPGLPLGLPTTWQRLRRSTLALGATATGVTGEPPPLYVYAAGPGARPWTDRDYRTLRVPAEVTGLRSIRFSHDRARTDASLRFRALEAVRVYVAFAEADPGDGWLDPQPGFTLLAERVVESDAYGRLHDAWYRDFPAGDVDLFPGLAGNWLLLAIGPVP
jgi:hypothetical protein